MQNLPKQVLLLNSAMESLQMKDSWNVVAINLPDSLVKLNIQNFKLRFANLRAVEIYFDLNSLL